jgi:5-methylcytosine-specific restriction endonuclease McrA
MASRVCRTSRIAVPANQWQEHNRQVHGVAADSSHTWRTIRASIIQRNGGRCQTCGTTHNLTVHHIGERHDNRPEMLVTLCASCHRAETP